MRKKSMLLGVTLAILVQHASSMDEDLMKRLESTFQKVITNATFPSGLPLPEKKDFESIEREFGPLHPSHRDFLFRFNNREFEDTGYDPFRANGGLNSTLVEKIHEARDKDIPNHWIPFCHADEAYWCVHSESGKVALFEIYPELEKTEKLTSINELLRILFLQEDVKIS